MADLWNVDDALAHILGEIEPLPAEAIALAQALDRVLAEDIIAGESLPPFANSSMDGFAVRAADVAPASPDSPVLLAVVMDIAAGAQPVGEVLPGQAARIMTGAPLPDGADAVVPVEETDAAWDAAADAPPPAGVNILRRVRAGAHVRAVGEDIRAGQTVLKAGMVILPQYVGLLAALGRARLNVVRQPLVAVIATGDELLDVDEALAPGKIRNSNSYTLAAFVQASGGIPVRIPTARDTLEDTRRAFHEALAHGPDLVLSSAGVSVGAHDVVRAVLDELGEVRLWRLNLRPGKPLAYGRLGGVPFFGLPGNPVSSMVTFEVMVRPVLNRLGGRPDHVPAVTAALAEDARSDGRRTYLRVTLAQAGGGYVAHLTGTQSSGAQLSMVLADGLLVIPEGVEVARAGERFTVRLLRPVT